MFNHAISLFLFHIICKKLIFHSFVSGNENIWPTILTFHSFLMLYNALKKCDTSIVAREPVIGIFDLYRHKQSFTATETKLQAWNFLCRK